MKNMISHFISFLPSTDIPILPAICDQLDFRSSSQGDSTGLGSFFQRHLQFDGPLCNPNVLDAARKDPNLSTFVSLIEKANLSDIFLCAGPFTVLAPTNDSFAALDAKTLQELMSPANQAKLQDLLLYHIVPGFYMSGTLPAGPLATLLPNQTIAVTLNPTLFNGRASVVEDDILACNGAIFVIDDVLVPGAATTFSLLHTDGVNHSSNALFSSLLECRTGFLLHVHFQ
jgi:hypothetical protein